GNFIVARGVIKQIPPVNLAFYRWLTGTLILLPIAWKKFSAEWPVIKANAKYLFWVAISGITLYNTFLYVAGHHVPAINLALIATTTSPLMVIVLAAVFLKEKITWLRFVGLLLCLAGVLLLMSRGDLDRLLGFRFTTGDWWILLGALCFAVYNTLVKRKPSGLSPTSFLLAVFAFGTLMLLPAFIWETAISEPVHFDLKLIGIILYLGAGACVISYLCWNEAIAILGSARTALFGNLIPIFSTFEAVIILGEEITDIHIISGLIVIAGLVLCNLTIKRKVATTQTLPQ
ncbi:MAG: DMT family transporter, partial [Chitinophagaceae bacterium]